MSGIARQMAIYVFLYGARRARRLDSKVSRLIVRPKKAHTIEMDKVTRGISDPNL